jgi:hypothetical protein
MLGDTAPADQANGLPTALAAARFGTGICDLEFLGMRLGCKMSACSFVGRTHSEPHPSNQNHGTIVVDLRRHRL